MVPSSKYIRTEIFEADIDCLPDFVEEMYITTKFDLLEDVRKRSKKLLASISNSTQHTTSYYNQYKTQLDMFYEQIKKTVLPKRLEPFWRYTYEFTPSGSILLLEHVKELEATVDAAPEDERVTSETVDQVFFLFAIEGDFLTVDEYAKKYEVEAVTVRQWIRRGKLKTAQKVGKEWIIPALTDIPGRGYEGGQYRIRGNCDDAPEEFSYLKDFKLITIWQDSKEKNTYHVKLSDMKGIRATTKDIDLTNDERERLELYLMSTRSVQFVGDNQSYCHKMIEKPEPDADAKDQE